MGIREILTVTCQQCGFEDDDVPFAPTCDFVDWKCPECGFVVDLMAMTGISYEDASNSGEIYHSFRLEGALRELLKEPPMYETADKNGLACSYCHREFYLFHAMGHAHVKDAQHPIAHASDCLWRNARQIFSCSMRKDNTGGENDDKTE